CRGEPSSPRPWFDGDVDRAGNVASPVDLRRSCVDKNNPVASAKSFIQVPGVDFVLKLRLVIADLVVHRYPQILVKPREVFSSNSLQRNPTALDSDPPLVLNLCEHEKEGCAWTRTRH